MRLASYIDVYIRFVPVRTASLGGYSYEASHKEYCNFSGKYRLRSEQHCMILPTGGLAIAIAFHIARTLNVVREYNIYARI